VGFAGWIGDLELDSFRPNPLEEGHPMTAPIPPEYLAGLLATCEAATPKPSDHELSGRRLALARLALADAAREALPRLIAEIERLGKERDEAREDLADARSWKQAVVEIGAKCVSVIARAEKAEAERDEARALLENEWSTTEDVARQRDAAIAERDVFIASNAGLTTDILTMRDERDAALAAQRDCAADLARIGRELGEAQAENDATARVIGDYMLVPPDGGDLKLHEGAQQMRDALNAALADVATLREAAKLALHEMCNTNAPRNSFTDAVDALDTALEKTDGK
jgi:uncharacterized protein (UPF0335 family)